ncbi:MAG: hypothetical protein WC130_11355, partial [Kiritimatiellia bacterium]
MILRSYPLGGDLVRCRAMPGDAATRSILPAERPPGAMPGDAATRSILPDERPPGAMPGDAATRSI